MYTLLCIPRTQYYQNEFYHHLDSLVKLGM